LSKQQQKADKLRRRKMKSKQRTKKRDAGRLMKERVKDDGEVTQIDEQAEESAHAREVLEPVESEEVETELIENDELTPPAIETTKIKPFKVKK
jgi:hypothetical protein